MSGKVESILGTLQQVSLICLGSRSGPRGGLPSGRGAAIRVLRQESNMIISFLVNLAELSILFCATHLLRSILWVSLVPLSPLEWIVRKC